MAEDSTPNIGLIVKVGGIMIVSVIIIRLGLTSYFGYMEDTEHAHKYVEMGQQAREGNLKAKDDEMKALAGGPMPIDKAMAMIAAQNRAVPGLEPQAADPMREKDTLAGWAQMPRELPSSLTNPAPSGSTATEAPAPSTSGSAAAPAPSGSVAPAPSGSAATAPSASAPPAMSSAPVPPPAPAPSASNH
jgi:hypothetical protein